MTTTETNKPAATIRFGGVKGVIWANAGKDPLRPRYSVQYLKSYTDENGKWHDTTSLNESDNLRLGHLIPKVADRIAELKELDRNVAAAQAAEDAAAA